MGKKISRPRAIHLRIVEVMKRFPEGVSEEQIRRELVKEGVSQKGIGNIGRRIRELDTWFLIETRDGDKTQHSPVTGRLRVEVLYWARGRCQRCSRSIEEDGIALRVQHKNPANPRFSEDRDDFWAICEQCSCALLRCGTRTSTRPRPKCCGAAL